MTVHHDFSRWQRDIQARTEGEAWRDKLLLNRSGDPKPVEFNVGVVLQHAPPFKGRLRLNELTGAAEGRDLPWREGGDWRPWTDVDDAMLAAWCQHQSMMAKPTTCATAVQMIAAQHPHYPVRTYLDGLRWDGTPRLDGWLASYLGATVEPGREAYLRAVGRKALIQAVARAHEPGCKADHALILQGPQGCRKSSAVATLAPDPAWFADEVADLGSKDAAQDLRGKWLIELAELSAMRRSEVERVKAFISRRSDHYRPSYGRRSQDFPRQCIFIGTTNADAYLGDETGGRRFWPVKVGRINLDALRRDRDQLWAEAVVAYLGGERWHLDDEAERLAAEEQAERRPEDAWGGPLLAWAERCAQPFTMGEALADALGVPVERQDRSAQMRAAAILKTHGYRRRQKRQGSFGSVWVYERPEPLDGGGGSGARPGGVGHASGEVGCAPGEVGDGPRAGSGSSAGSEVGEVGYVGYKKVQQGQVCNQPHQPNQPLHERYQEKRTGVTKGGWLVGEVGDGPPPWQDTEARLARLRPLKGDPERRFAELRAWAEAAGYGFLPGKTRCGGTLIEPAGLPDCPAKFVLRKQARDAGLKVREPAGVVR